jgi:gluconate 2-dehydrogenase gamma chain
MPTNRDNHKEEAASALTRRDLLKAAAGALAAAPLLDLAPTAAPQPQAKPAASGSAPLFFTKDEFAMVDELTELIIPADDHSPGARAAEVAAYIDKRLAETWEKNRQQMWRSGLETIDFICKTMHGGKRFLDATPDQRVVVLSRISQNELKPEKPEERFFKELKSRTAHAYYTSSIGIHKEMEYKGNVYLRQFAGTDVSQK